MKSFNFCVDLYRLCGYEFPESIRDFAGTFSTGNFTHSLLIEFYFMRKHWMLVDVIRFIEFEISYFFPLLLRTD